MTQSSGLSWIGLLICSIPRTKDNNCRFYNYMASGSLSCAQLIECDVQNMKSNIAWHTHIPGFVGQKAQHNFCFFVFFFFCLDKKHNNWQHMYININVLALTFWFYAYPQQPFWLFSITIINYLRIRPPMLKTHGK